MKTEACESEEIGRESVLVKLSGDPAGWPGRSVSGHYLKTPGLRGRGQPRWPLGLRTCSRHTLGTHSILICPWTGINTTYICPFLTYFLSSHVFHCFWTLWSVTSYWTLISDFLSMNLSVMYHFVFPSILAHCALGGVSRTPVCALILILPKSPAIVPSSE